MILIIHPHDKSTGFLGSISQSINLHCRYPVDVFNIHPNDESRDECYKRILVCNTNDLIIFLGHGRSDALYGSKGDRYDNSDFESIEAQTSNPEFYYYNEHFINRSNSYLLDGKKVIAVACNSNSFGTFFNPQSFIGFGAIPTSIGEFKDVGNNNPSDKLVALMKGRFNTIIRDSIVYAINRGYTFFQLKELMQFLIQQNIAQLTHCDDRQGEWVSGQLYQIKHDIVVLGDGNQKLTL